MSESSRQLTLFDCGGPFSKRSRVECVTPLSNITDGANSHMQALQPLPVQVCDVDICDRTHDELCNIESDSSVSSIPPTPRHSTPIFIDSSSNEGPAAFPAIFSPGPSCTATSIATGTTVSNLSMTDTILSSSSSVLVSQPTDHEPSDMHRLQPFLPFVQLT